MPEICDQISGATVKYSIFGFIHDQQPGKFVTGNVMQLLIIAENIARRIHYKKIKL
jgi:hypothetical protein